MIKKFKQSSTVSTKEAVTLLNQWEAVMQETTHFVITANQH